MVASPVNRPTTSVNRVRLENSYEDLYRQAQQHLGEQNFEAALEIFQRISSRLGKMSEKALERRPNLRDLRLFSLDFSAQILSLHGDLAGAINQYEQLLELGADNAPRYRQALAQLKIDQGEVEAGLDELRALAVGQLGEAWTWLVLGTELLYVEQYDEAETSLKRVAEREDVDLQHRREAYRQLFDLYQAQARYDEAEQAWLNLWQADASPMEDVSPLYQMFWSVEQLEQASRWLEEEKNPLRYGFYRGLVAQAMDDEQAAQKFWRRTADRNPFEHQDGHESWAEAVLRIETSPDQVIQVLSRLANRNLINLRGILLLAIAHIRADNKESAHKTLEIATNMVKSRRPRRTTLEIEHWALLTDLVADEAVTAEFKDYFEVAN